MEPTAAPLYSFSLDPYVVVSPSKEHPNFLLHRHAMPHSTKWFFKIPLLIVEYLISVFLVRSFHSIPFHATNVFFPPDKSCHRQSKNY